MPSERANHWASGSLRWKEIEKQGFSLLCLKPLYIAHRRFCAYRRFSGGGGSTKNGGGGVSTKNGTRDGTIAAVVCTLLCTSVARALIKKHFDKVRQFCACLVAQWDQKISGALFTRYCHSIYIY